MLIGLASVWRGVAVQIARQIEHGRVARISPVECHGMVCDEGAAVLLQHPAPMVRVRELHALEPQGVRWHCRFPPPLAPPSNASSTVRASRDARFCLWHNINAALCYTRRRGR